MDSPEKRKKILKTRQSPGIPLVTDQAGLKVVLIGLFLAFLLSFLFKGLTHPGRVQTLINKALVQIPSEIKITNEEAHVSLSDGVLPRFAIVVKNIRMESKNPCWMSPFVTIDELTLPLSVTSLLMGEVRLQKVVAQQLDVELREDLSQCNTTKNAKIESVQKVNTNPGVSLHPIVTSKSGLQKPLAENSERGHDTILPAQDFFIHKILIKSLGKNSFEFRMSDFELSSPERNLHRFEIKAKTQMMKDESVGDYLSHSNISIEYKDFPYHEVVAHLFGHWREGYYSLATLIRPEENTFTLSSEIKHIPLSLVLSQLSKLGFNHKNFNGKEVWVSLQTEAQGNVSQYKEAHGIIKNFKIEGPVGDFSFDEVVFQQLNPFKYDPFEIQIKKLDLSKLLKLLNQPTSSMLGHLGEFSGVANWRGDHDLKLSGVLDNVEFIFGNKGRREIQKINQIETQVVYLNKNWDFDFSKLNFQGGSFLGDLHLKSDQYFKNISLKFRGDDVRFSPQVENLLTQSGALDPFQVQADFLIEDGRVKSLYGFLKGNSVLVENTKVSQWKINLETQPRTHEFVGKVSFDSLVSQKNSALLELIDPVLHSKTVSILDDEDKLEISKMNVQLKSKTLKDLAWKVLSGTFKPMEIGLSSEGGWTVEGEVYGNLLFKTQKESNRWILSGDRKNIQIKKD